MPTTAAVLRVLTDGPATAADVSAETGCTTHQALGMLWALQATGSVVRDGYIVAEDRRGRRCRQRLWRLSLSE